MRRWAGPLITTLIVGGIALILVMNLNLEDRSSPGHAPPGKPTLEKEASTAGPTIDAGAVAKADLGKPRGVVESPIGDDVARNGMDIAAVWMPAVAMDGQGPDGSDIIHIEADVKAAEANPQGFALGEFVPYLVIDYTITPASGGEPLQKGRLVPMVASDGLHYGANVAMPKAGDYRLTYAIQPPSAGGLGRHSDRLTGVAPWWTPFDATFEWEYAGPPKAAP